MLGTLTAYSPAHYNMSLAAGQECILQGVGRVVVPGCAQVAQDGRDRAGYWQPGQIANIDRGRRRGGRKKGKPSRLRLEGQTGWVSEMINAVEKTI